MTLVKAANAWPARKKGRKAKGKEEELEFHCWHALRDPSRAHLSYEDVMQFATSACGYWRRFIDAVHFEPSWEKAKLHKDGFVLLTATAVAFNLLNDLLLAMPFAYKEEDLPADVRARIFRMVDGLNATDRESAATLIQSENLALANRRRKEYASALREAVEELDRKHPDWSHVRMAKELEADRCVHVNGRAYTARHICKIRNEIRLAARIFGR